jgi:hypothetical protein
MVVAAAGVADAVASGLTEELDDWTRWLWLTVKTIEEEERLLVVSVFCLLL